MKFCYANFLFLFLFFLSSCTDFRQKSAEGQTNSTEIVTSANAQGFEGAEGEGFAGIFSPKISMLLAPSLTEIKKGKVVTLKGSNFFEGIKVKISEIDCVIIALIDSGSLKCALSETVDKVNFLTAINTHGPATTVVPTVVLDTDGDGIPDTQDNCPEAGWDTDQTDEDHDGIGDVCDSEFNDRDWDSIPDITDNCPDDANRDQSNSLDAQMGDVCNPEFTLDNDKDGIYNTNDNCKDAYNPDQEDLDANGSGDACE